MCIVGSKKQKAIKEHEINEGKKRTNVNPTFSPIGSSNWTKYSLYLTKINNNNNNVKKGLIQGFNLLQFDPWDFGSCTIT